MIGRSIGTGAAAHHVTLSAPQKILLLSPFAQFSDVAHRITPIYPRWFITTQFDNSTALQSYNGVVTIIHGNKDFVVPIAQGQKLFDMLQTQKKVFIEVTGAGHADIFETGTVMQQIRKMFN